MFELHRISCRLALLAVLVIALCAAPALAQCNPDGLDLGPCCAPAGLQLPPFPAIQQQIKFICFDNCNPAINANICATIGNPNPVTAGGGVVCGIYLIRFQISTCAGLNIWNGTMRAHYSRNWQESSIPGAVNLTVHRFLLNGDMVPTAALPNNQCVKPSCFNTFQRVYFTGYIDYAFDCVTGGWQAAWMLSHECDSLHHAANSVRPAPAAGFHPTRSFTFVGPGPTFTVTSVNVPQSNGPIIQEAMRWNNWAALPAICTFEERVQGSFQAVNDFCVCSSAGAPQYIATNVQAQGACGSAINPSPIGPFLQKRIGMWNNANVYPGLEFLLLDLGSLNWVNGCTGTSTIEWYEGVETIRGYPAFDFSGNALGFQFEDLGSANRGPNNPVMHIGAPHISFSILNFNLP
jgi:hypothetical protein